MEVFNASGQSGMAIIHMDNKQAVRLKFHYRINISIAYASQEDSQFNTDTFHFNTLNTNGDTAYPVTMQNAFTDSLGGVFEVSHYNNATDGQQVGLAIGQSQNMSSTIKKDRMVALSEYSLEKTQNSTFSMNDQPESVVSNKPGDSMMDSKTNLTGFFDSANSLKEQNADKYKQVRENLSNIFQERRKAAHENENNLDNDIQMEDGAHNEEIGEEEEGEAMFNDLDKSAEEGEGFTNLNSSHKELSYTDAGDGNYEVEEEEYSHFPCSVCQLVFNSKDMLMEHQRASTTRIKCLVCKEDCMSRAHLLLHDYIAHTSQGNMSKNPNKECPLCQHPFSDDFDLVDHIKDKHTHETVYKCCLCDKAFHNGLDYQQHVNACKKDKAHRKLIKSNKKVAPKYGRKAKHKSKSKLKAGGAPESGITKCRGTKRLTKDISSNDPIETSATSLTKVKITLKKQDKATAKLKKAKLNAQYYQKLKQQRLLKKQQEAEEREAHGDSLLSSLGLVIIEKGSSSVGKDCGWDKTWKCKFCDRIFMSMREFNSHTMPMRTKRVCTKCGDRSKSKAEYMLHQCKKEMSEQDDGENKASRGNRKCPVCEEEILKKDILHHVMFQHTGEMPHLCCICGIPLESYDSWVSHCQSFHATVGDDDLTKNSLFSHVSFTNSQNNDEIVCKLCKSTFTSQKDFVHHHKCESVRKVCNICGTWTFTEAGYIVHRYLSHGLSPEESHILAIPPCYDSSNNNFWEEDRLGEWSSESLLECVKCPCCPEDVNTKDLLFHVMEKHTHESPFKCCACENVSPSKTHYIQHCDFHLGKREYNNKTPRCLQCDLRFESRRALNSHKQFHQKRCPYCQMEFSSAVFLKIHLQNYHTNDMEACSFCSKLFACSTQLAEHERHHYFSKQSQCTVCGKLIFARNMAKHMKIAHPKSDDDCFFCAVCNKRFRDRHQMEQHQLCHSTENTHECDVCKKKFKNGIRLREHAKVHLEKKRLFVCDICGKTCTEKYNLQVHMRVHSNKKEFHCPICNQGFNYNQSLKSHMEKEHNKVPVGPQHFNCSICNIPFGYVHTMEAHMREKHGHSPTNYGPASQWYSN